MSTPTGAEGAASPEPGLANPAPKLLGPTNGAPAKPPFYRRRAGRVFLGVGAVVLAVLLSLLAWFYFDGALGANFHQVSPAPHALYRSAQLPAGELRERVEALGVKTVLNLRGENNGKPWYDAEVEALKQAGVTLIDIKMSGKHMPTRERLVQLITALESAPRPLLVHCQYGSDRTGLACAFERLETGADFTTARKELAFFPYGHTGHFGYENMDHVVDQYERYKQGGGGLGLRAWAEQLYDPGANVD